MDLYGKTTVSRFRLALTDDDHAEHGPLDNSIATLPYYKNCKHMLCVFHAVVMAFMKDVYHKLPSTGTGKNRKVTSDGNIFGMFMFVSSIYLFLP